MHKKGNFVGIIVFIILIIITYSIFQLRGKYSESAFIFFLTLLIILILGLISSLINYFYPNNKISAWLKKFIRSLLESG